MGILVGDSMATFNQIHMLHTACKLLSGWRGQVATYSNSEPLTREPAFIPKPSDLCTDAAMSFVSLSAICWHSFSVGGSGCLLKLRSYMKSPLTQELVWLKQKPDDFLPECMLKH